MLMLQIAWPYLYPLLVTLTLTLASDLILVLILMIQISPLALNLITCINLYIELVERHLLRLPASETILTMILWPTYRKKSDGPCR